MEKFVGIALVFVFIYVIVKGELQIKRKKDSSNDLISINFNKAKKYIQQSISKSYLTGCSWILANESGEDILYIFRSNDELLITKSGIVERCQYELIIDNNSIIITKNGIIEQYNIVNIQDDFLFLNRLSSDKIMVFANQTKFKDEMKSVINRKAKEIYNY